MSWATPHAIARGGKRTRPSWTFTALTPGGVAVPTGMGFSRASTTDCQTSDTTNVHGISVDTPIVTQRTSSATSRGFKMDTSRTNRDQWSQGKKGADTAGFWGTSSGTITSDQAAGPDGSGTPADRVTVTTGNGIGVSSAIPYNIGAHNCQVSIWCRSVSGTTEMQISQGASTVGGVFSRHSGITTAWQRVAPTYRAVASSGTGQIGFADQRNLGLGGNGANCDVYLSDCQIETGKYPTETIQTTGGDTTKAGPRWWVVDGVSCHEGGRVDLRIKFIPTASSSNYDEDAWKEIIWKDASNNVKWSTTTHELYVTIAGVTWITAAVTWSAYDVVEISLSVGGGVVVSKGFYRLNGGATVNLGTSGAPQPYWALTGSLYILCNSSATEVFSSATQELDFGPPQAWAA